MILIHEKELNSVFPLFQHKVTTDSPLFFYSHYIWLSKNLGDDALMPEKVEYYIFNEYAKWTFFSLTYEKSYNPTYFFKSEEDAIFFKLST